MKDEDLTKQVIGCAYKVYNTLYPVNPVNPVKEWGKR
jgi:hypothetical protein